MSFKMVLPLIICLFLCSPGTGISQEIDYCEGDFDYDGDVDSFNITTFLSDFGRGSYINPCPFAGPAPVHKTGQIAQFAAGDDGDLSRGISWPEPRFIDSGDGTVKDQLTGLIWLKNADCFGLTSSAL